VDNPTHLLTGYFMSRAGLNRLTPNATAILLLSANIPDIDIVTIAGGWINYLHWHRSWTHALLVSPLLALASVVIVRVAARTPLPWIAATFVAWLGVLSHLLLDWTNQYGIRLLLPFSPRWYQLDNTTLFDIWIYAGFAVCLFAPLLARLVGGEISGQIGAPPRGRAGQGWAIVALLFLGLYFAGRGVVHGRLIDVLDAHDYDDSQPVRIAAFPQASSPFTWRGVAESSAAYHVYTLNLLGAPFDPSSGRTLYKPASNAAIEAAAKTPVFQIFREFAQYPLFQTVPSAEVENGTQVDLVDIRFPFHCRAIVDGENRVRRTEYPVYGW
jgi:inner membrane protein